MNLRSLFGRLLTIAVTCGLVGGGAARADDLTTQMDNMFGTMTNVTSPTAYMGQSRGVISGGSFEVRTSIAHPNLISFDPPHMKAGCGGIDMYGGSLSFISKDQFVELLRTIAANASGYLFSLALSQMCPNCAHLMHTLQQDMQRLNSGMTNSCQMVEGAFARAGIDQGSFSGLQSTWLNTTAGTVNDWLSGSSQSPNKTDPNDLAMQNTPAQFENQVTGNMMWKALLGSSAGSWFSTTSTDLQQYIMSLTGSIVLCHLQDPGCPASPQTQPGNQNMMQTNWLPPLFELTDLVYGASATGPLKHYVCDDPSPDKCFSPGVEQDGNFKGMLTRVNDILLGGDGYVGIVNKYCEDSGQLSAEEQSFIEMSGLAGKAVRDFASEAGCGTALSIGARLAPQIAVDLSYQIAIDLMKAAEGSARGAVGNPGFAKMLEELRNRRQALIQEKNKLDQENQINYSNVAYLNQMMQALPKTPRPSMRDTIVRQ